MYNNAGWGYKRISNYLTAQGIPTPRMSEKQRKDEAGAENKIKAKPEWSIVSVQGILDNDFYIGTFRQRKYTKKVFYKSAICCLKVETGQAVFCGEVLGSSLVIEYYEYPQEGTALITGISYFPESKITRSGYPLSFDAPYGTPESPVSFSTWEDNAYNIDLTKWFY